MTASDTIILLCSIALLLCIGAVIGWHLRERAARREMKRIVLARWTGEATAVSGSSLPPSFFHPTNN